MSFRKIPLKLINHYGIFYIRRVQYETAEPTSLRQPCRTSGQPHQAKILLLPY